MLKEVTKEKKIKKADQDIKLFEQQIKKINDDEK